MMFLLISIISLVFHVTHGRNVVTCGPLTTCSCETFEGVIDLHPLARNDGTPRFRDIQDKDGKTFFSWNPCYGFNEGTCRNVAACRIQDHGQTCTSLGKQSSAQSVSDSEYGLIFRYTNWGGSNYSAHVIITCDPTQEGTLSRRPDADYVNVNFFLELKSKYACPMMSNRSTTTAPTTESTRSTTHRITPAFIGTAKTPKPTVPPIFDVNTLGTLMVVVLVLLSILILLVTGLLIAQITRRRKSFMA